MFVDFDDTLAATIIYDHSPNIHISNDKSMFDSMVAASVSEVSVIIRGQVNIPPGVDIVILSLRYDKNENRTHRVKNVH